MNIRKIKNGIVLTDEQGMENFFTSCDELFATLLLLLEGRGRYFGGDSYGHVFVARKAGDKFTAPEEVEPA